MRRSKGVDFHVRRHQYQWTDEGGLAVWADEYHPRQGVSEDTSTSSSLVIVFIAGRVGDSSGSPFIEHGHRRLSCTTRLRRTDAHVSLGRIGWLAGLS